MMQKYKLLPNHLNFNLKNFIKLNINADKNALILKLKSSKQDEFCADLVIETLNNYKKALVKMPLMASNFCWLPNLGFEQASSEKTADYKSKLFKGNTILDLTGGLGIDDLAFAKQFKQVISLDINKELNQIVKHNFEILLVKNIERKDELAEYFLNYNEDYFDVIYLDADRRPEAKGKKIL